MFAVFETYADSTLLNLAKGEAKTIDLDKRGNVETVFITDPKVADYKVITPSRVVIYGVGLGTTSIIMYDRSGNEIYNVELVVNQSLRLLKQTLVARFPNEHFQVSNVGDHVVLDGTVSSEEVKQKIYRVVGEMLNQKRTRNVYSAPEMEGEDDTGDNELSYSASYVYETVINNLKVLSTNQINVKLTVAEVSNSFLSQLGVTYGGPDTGTFVNKLLDFSAEDIVTVISANKDDSIGQILAEPNLSVISGEKASFLVGGEIPIAVSDNNSVSVDYKEYGVKLSMIAKVTDSDNIRLSLFPEVSSIDETNKTTTGSVSAPALKTRRAHTTVQLKNGQSFVLAGLLTSEEREAMSQVPLLGDIPILGALFNSSATKRVKTELIIVATVNLVNPVEERDVKLPAFKKTSDVERLLGLDFPVGKENSELQQTFNQGGFK
ncbi:pilus assembly protein N-terminal domain-containing protein [Vibrio parahaemolyticus]|uniref:type II and III secretion system protein family protein n=1 Tax=Vibrio parahaemolyticus TaxID=670 RepID=UPI001EECDD8A|nr:pilus assembly protein N-terminal domain-containing protein [Vibrio parahaemolyticus]MCG6461799.1 pilus assembly protein N-terminal domain-containing protein [Vibrio parahaemolyticus]